MLTKKKKKASFNKPNLKTKKKQKGNGYITNFCFSVNDVYKHGKHHFHPLDLEYDDSALIMC